MAELRVTTGPTDDSLGASRRTIAGRGRSFETPRRALSLTATGDCEAIFPLAKGCGGLVELYREISPAVLRSIDKDTPKQQAFAAQLMQRINRLPSADQFVLFVVSVSEKSYVPSTEETEYLADLAAAPFVDAVCVPALSAGSVEDFLKYANDFLSTIVQTRSVPLMGFVPHFAYRDVGKVVNFYLKRAIKDFVIDFDGHPATSIYPNLQLVRRLVSAAVGENFYLHGLNVGTGPFPRTVPISPAKDFIALISGSDTMGPKHTVRRMPPEVWNRLIAQGINLRRAFSRKDYGYYAPASLRRSLGGGNGAGLIPLSRVVSNPSAPLLKAFNAERQALEAGVLRNRLREGSLAVYVRGKRSAAQEIEQIIRQNSRRQQTLSV